MSWLVRFPWSESIKKRACRYLLQRYLGQFLEEKLTLDQLTVDLYNGTGRVTNVSLDVQALNEMGEQQHLPLEFVDGFISEMSVSIPWSALLSEASYVEVKGLKITVQPRQRSETGTSMFESMWSSMTSSMQLAQECLQQDANNAGGNNAQPLEGVELFAQTIDSILCRVRVRFIDTVIRLEHVPLDSTTGVAIEMCIKNLEYSDEAGSDPSNVNLDANQSKGYVVSAFTTKRFYLEGVTFHTDEFPSRARTFSRSVMTTSRGSTPDSKNSDGHFSSAQISPTQHNIPTPPDRNLINTLSQSNPIMCAKITGRQEIRLKIKQGEGILGPKVELEVTLGSFISFLSPRQVHVLMELGHGLASPDLEDISNVAPRTCTEKPMAGSDFSRVERELMHQLHPVHGLRTTDLRNTQGWSTASLDESDNEDEFLPMKLPGGMSDSQTTNNISMDESISASSISSKSSVTNVTKPHKHRANADTDPTAETSQFHVRVSSIAVILLHEDILTTGIESRGLTCASTEQMKNAAEEFFNKLGIFAADGYGNKNFDKAAKIFLDACRLSHIRLLAAPLVVEGSEKTTPQASAIAGSLTLATLEIVECLVDTSNNSETPKVEYVELLTFDNKSTATDNFGLLNTTDFRMRFKYTEKAVRHAQTTRFAHPRTEIDIQLEPCQSEVDITIIDRISSVLNPQPICTYNPSSTAKDTWNQHAMFYQAVESPILSDSRVNIKVSSSRAIFKVRFPVPDLRPLHDMSRAPWWTRSVRSDFITLTLNDAQFHMSMDTQAHYLSRQEIQCRQVLLTYTEIDSDIPVKIANSHVNDKQDSLLPQEGECFGWPRMVFTIYPQHLGGPLEDSSEEEPGSSLDEPLGQPPRHQPSPFSSKRVIHESDTPHSESQSHTNKDDHEHREGEELVIPGNRQEMLEFMEEGTHGSRVQIDISLPCLSVQIPSKHLYEQIYNRINTDLFLWEPSAPRPKYTNTDSHGGLDLASTLLQESIYPKFSMCKSGIQYNSDSDSDDDGVFHSTAGKSFNQTLNKAPKNGQSKMSLTFNINQGLLTMYTPVRDGLSNVIPGQQGELILRVEDATIFCVNSYKGNGNLGYVCTMIKNVSLYHCGITTIPSTTPPLRSLNSVIPRHCQPAIYRSHNGLQENIEAAEDADMLTVAVRIQAAHQTHHIKTFRVAVGIRNATLRHRMCSAQTSWFTQLTDCLDVIDHPVAGYSPPGVLTELHLHLWNCAVDYRPLFLPLRSMITLGSFSVSSNIAAKTNTSTLRFIAEDVALFLSEKLGNHVDLKRDYVGVMDLGLFELSLRLNEKMYGGAPRVDLRASNNVLHVRTCADSGRALMQLLTYFASDGDLTPNIGSTESIAVPSSGDEESLLGEESINTLSKSQEERVNSLMEEAMEDTVRGSTTSLSKKSPEEKAQVEVFFFPDEPHPATQVPEMNNNHSNNNTTPAARGTESDDTDEDFCILGEEAGAGIMPRHGIPEIRWLSQEYIRVVDNHFAVPLGKTDLLKAPKHFPAPVLRYTLCEMTLVWHMYGGKDFGNPHQVVKKKNVTIDDPGYRFDNSVPVRSRSAVVGFSKMNPHEVKFGSAPNSPCGKTKSSSKDWYTQGGPGRQHDVLMELQLNKVRFQHETYPENTTEASRQVLLISEIEIRDRLASSHINKFLYQYSSEARPRQTHANMFAMKAVHVRPDPKFSAQECCLKLSLLPLRLNIDQDSLLFFIDFFTELTGNMKASQDNINGPSTTQSSPGSKQSTPTHHPPVMSVNEETSDLSSLESTNPIDNSIVDQNLMILLEDELTIKENKTKIKTNCGSQDDSQPIYFRSVIFAPEVLVRLDYHGKRVDLTHGPMAGLLMGLAQLNCSELRLKRLTHRHGLLGIDKLMAFMLAEWLQDIKKNQLPSLLGGVGPMHSLVQLFQGFRDLFWLPIEQYQKDGRIVRGLQRGANSFTTSTAMAALELTSRLVHVIQSTAETAYDMVSPGPSVRRKTKGQKGRRKRYSQPLDIREGMANAYMLVKEGLGETANQLVRVASEEHEQKGVSGAVGGVLRQIPPTVVKPIILATEATSNVLGGMRSQLVPDARREAAQKWRQDPRDVN
ncbi:autophagy-related protein 2 homolog B [Microplitis demolitor]|uniref:autophagy-related protein 2 homolog B n=1 Tax=Microplitis demolitor TaxID=69319 RepID=UPI0004CDC498|nr:autophagy-related protein 2 homolog B [Microplitis demolitor]XP_008558252.1 autophagy-related protein 2 homolog B [Microplitis demolitor]XP_014298605.1 autophagy-related protein 2 homolog B [Microplitis demolitor]